MLSITCFNCGLDHPPATSHDAGEFLASTSALQSMSGGVCRFIHDVTPAPTSEQETQNLVQIRASSVRLWSTKPFRTPVAISAEARRGARNVCHTSGAGNYGGMHDESVLRSSAASRRMRTGRGAPTPLRKAPRPPPSPTTTTTTRQRLSPTTTTPPTRPTTLQGGQPGSPRRPIPTPQPKAGGKPWHHGMRAGRHVSLHAHFRIGHPLRINVCA